MRVSGGAVRGWSVAIGLWCAALGASHAQGSAACAAQLDPAHREQLQRCEAVPACRQNARLMEAQCPALQAFVGQLVAHGPAVNEHSLRRALIDSGVPAGGIASCMGSFSAALCRQFLRLEDGAGGPRQEPAREQQLQAEVRRLQEQHERARMPADAHRFAELKLAMCAQARQMSEREVQCGEATQAVQACSRFRDDWVRRRTTALAEAERLALESARRALLSLDLAPCAQTLPQSQFTPAQALAQWAQQERPSAPATPAAPVAAATTSAALATPVPGAPAVATASSSPVAPAGTPPAAASVAPVPALAAAPAGLDGGVGPAGAKSVCLRNIEQIHAALRGAGLQFHGVAHDLVTMQLQQQTMRLLQPCLAWDSAARAEHEQQRLKAEAVRQRCAGEHPVDECRPWGERDADNRRYFARWRAEADLALADPRYSAELGPARVAAPPPAPPAPAVAPPAVLAAASAPAAAVAAASLPVALPPMAPPPAAAPPVATAPALLPATAPAAPGAPMATRYGSDCKSALSTMETDFEVIEQRRPANAELLATLQTSLFMLSEQIGLLERLCRGQREYDYHAQMRERFDRTRQACRAAARNPAQCVPRVAW